MLRIGIVEDEKEYSDMLERYLKRYADEKKVEFDILTFSDGIAFSSKKSTDFDILFLDINMPLISGMQIAKGIRKTDNDIIIIFVTNLARYAIEGYEVDAMDFILKPLQYSSLSFRLDRAVSIAKKRQQTNIIIKINRDIVKLNSSDIYYIESNIHKIIYHTSKSNYEVWGSIARVKQELAGFHFASCSVSFFVNLSHVDGIEGDDALIGGERLKISRNNRKSFLDALTLYYANASESGDER